jgi:DNA mismatch endonuclease (patch repair protein)
MPKTRLAFWQEKFDRNSVRDEANLVALRAAGWRAEVIWECETKRPDALAARLDDIFGEAVDP